MESKKYKVIENNIEYEVTEWYNGTKWLKDGKCHRENGPAVEYVNGPKFWFKDGKYHRENGPAKELSSGTKEYWYEGKHVEVSSDEEYFRYLKLKEFW